MANTSDLDFYGLSTNEWIGMVLPYKSQKNQVDGAAGFGYRYRVAIMGNHPSDNSIKDEDIVFAIVALGVSDGTGAGNRQKTPAISQGDVVLGKFLDGDRRQNPVIMNVLGRTEGIKYGKGRFEAKSGFVGSTHAAGLFDRQESSEAHGPCSPKATISPKTKNKPNIEGLLKSGLPDIPTLDAIPKPEALNSLGEKLSGVSDQLGDELSGALSGATGEITEELGGALGDATEQLSGSLGGVTEQLSGATDQLSDKLSSAAPDLSARLNENLAIKEEKTGTGILGPISSNVNEMVNVPTSTDSTDSTPTDTVGGERTAPQLDRVTGDPGERTAPRLDRGGYNTSTPEQPSISVKYLNNKGMDVTKPQGGLTTQEYNNLSSRDRNLLNRELRISNSQGRLDTTFNPNTTRGSLTKIEVDGKLVPRGLSGPNETFGGKGGSTYEDPVGSERPEPKLDRVSGNPGERTAPRLDRGDNSITTQSITRQKNVSGSFDLQTGTAYINGKVVSFEEYNTFTNLSNAEKVAKYGQ